MKWLDDFVFSPAEFQTVLREPLVDYLELPPLRWSAVSVFVLQLRTSSNGSLISTKTAQCVGVTDCINIQTRVIRF